MAKLKFKEENGNYRLILSPTEMQVICKLLTHTRLGNPVAQDEFEDAVAAITHAIDEFDDTLLTDAGNNIELEAWSCEDGENPNAIIFDDNIMLVISKRFE